ncbi:Hypothetical protein FKW44_006240, partial [Caligus rogercresseyi]
QSETTKLESTKIEEVKETFGIQSVTIEHDSKLEVTEKIEAKTEKIVHITSEMESTNLEDKDATQFEGDDSDKVIDHKPKMMKLRIFQNWT